MICSQNLVSWDSAFDKMKALTLQACRLENLRSRSRRGLPRQIKDLYRSGRDTSSWQRIDAARAGAACNMAIPSRTEVRILLVRPYDMPASHAAILHMYTVARREGRCNLPKVVFQATDGGIRGVFRAIGGGIRAVLRCRAATAPTTQRSAARPLERQRLKPR